MRGWNLKLYKLLAMITKIEIDGFKTFRNFQMEFAPLTVIAGTNASGKSNLFDALHLLSRLAEHDLKTAFEAQRGDATEMFTIFNENMVSDQIFIAVEMIVNKKVKDKFGGEAILKYTRLRYEIRIVKRVNSRNLPELVVGHEQLEAIKTKTDKWVNNNIPKSKIDFWRPKVKSGRRGFPYIETESDRISLRQDGGGGMKKEFPLPNIFQPIITVVNSVDFPHVLAAKDELLNWRFLQLNPEDLRMPSGYLDHDQITHSGKNLSAALFRIKRSDPSALKEIERRLNLVLPNIKKLDVLDDKAGRQYVLKILNQDNRSFTSRVLSEGTLRLLALCTFLYDPEFSGVLCFEEPENGVHPARIKYTAKLLADLASDFSYEDDLLNQVIVNTHSPVLVDAVIRLKGQNYFKIWLSELATSVVELDGKKLQIQLTKMYPVEGDGPQTTLTFPEEIKKWTASKVEAYLTFQDSE